MKALTIHQPWATLLASGAKRFETRGWSPGFFGPVAIHAGRAWSPAYQELCFREPFRTALLRAGVREIPLDLPRGAIIGFGRIKSSTRTEVLRPSLDDVEKAFGDFRPGRFAWRIGDVRLLAHPIPVTGQQGLWDWESPDGYQPEYVCVSQDLQTEERRPAHEQR